MVFVVTTVETTVLVGCPITVEAAEEIPTGVAAPMMLPEAVSRGVDPPAGANPSPCASPSPDMV